MEKEKEKDKVGWVVLNEDGVMVVSSFLGVNYAVDDFHFPIPNCTFHN
jgi:hypothetical protein